MALDIFVVLIYAAGMIALGWYGMRRARPATTTWWPAATSAPASTWEPWPPPSSAAPPPSAPCAWATSMASPASGCAGAIGLGIVGLSLFLAKPLLKLKIYTVTQVLERRYNPAARHASALIMLVYALMIGATSTIAIGTVMQVLFGLRSGSRS